MSAIYVETSIVGYLTSRSASDVVFQARQELTRRWWQKRREGFDLYISQLVLDEAGAGDATAAADRRRLREGCERPPQPYLTVPIASRIDLVHPVFKEAFHGQAGESGEGTGVAEAVAAV
jgi:hypothetical protein